MCNIKIPNVYFLHYFSADCISLHCPHLLSTLQDFTRAEAALSHTLTALNTCYRSHEHLWRGNSHFWLLMVPLTLLMQRSCMSSSGHGVILPPPGLLCSAQIFSAVSICQRPDSFSAYTEEVHHSEVFLRLTFARSAVQLAPSHVSTLTVS